MTKKEKEREREIHRGTEIHRRSRAKKVKKKENCIARYLDKQNR